MARRRRRNGYTMPVKPGVVPKMMVFFVITVLAGIFYNWVITSKATQLGEKIKLLERESSSLDDEIKREKNKWEANLTPEKLKEAMNRLNLRPLSPSQIVYMGSNGKPIPNQKSLAKFARESQPGGKVAKR